MRTTDPATPTGPQRFQQPATPASSTSRARAAGAALLLLVVVVGVPAGLFWLGGVPQLPTSLPSREALTATIGLDQVLAVLLWIAWLAWLQFTVCVVVELVSALRGVGLPRRVPLAGPSQRAARTLVATALLLVTVAGQATALTHQVVDGPSHVSVVAVQAAAGTEAAPSATDAQAAGSGLSQQSQQALQALQGQGTEVPGTTYWLGGLQLDAEDGRELLGKQVYVVQPPDGRYHDNLWDIAERTLGDGRRYGEIFELNKSRPQPDGQELTLARLIQPGWLLVVPEGATGAERVTAVEPVAEPAPAPVVQTDDGAAAAASETAASAAASADAHAGGGAASSEEGAVSGTEHGTGAQLLGAGLLAAGLVAAVEQLRRRRRTAEPSDEAVDLEVALRIGADPSRAALLATGLRGLAELLSAAGRDLPEAWGAVVDDSELTLLLTDHTEPPAPWRRSDGGWTLDASDVRRPSRTAPAPFPGLVSVGRDAAGRDVLLDLEAAQGPVSVVGDAAAEVVTALAVELATNVWSDRVRVTGVGLADTLAVLPAERFRSARSVADALPALVGRSARVLGSGVLTGRLRGAGASAWMPEYLAVAAPTSAAEAAELVAVSDTAQRSPLGILVAGELTGARWRLEVDGDGMLRAPLLGLEVRANRMTARDTSALAELLTPAGELTWPELGSRPDPEGALDRPEVAPGARALEPADLAVAPVRVHLLGTPRVEARGPVPAERESQLTELVVHLALHPEGVHPSVLGAALWPRGVTREVLDAAVERAEAWLGEPSGAPGVVRDGDGRLRLGPEVVVDWDVVRTLLARARRAGDPAAERRDLAAALRLAPGPACTPHPPGRYAWLARARLERASRDLLVDAAHRLALLGWDGDDPAAAKEAAWAGLRVAPAEELLWRDLLRAVAAADGADAVRDVAADLEATLHSVGLAAPAPETSALIDELLPSTPAAPAVPGTGA